MMTMPGFRIAIAAAVATLALAGAANAQTYPNAQVRLIVPTSPGGVTDTMARIVAQRLTEQLGQAVIVDNRAGGNGSVGAIAVAHAPTDGLTLLVTSDATITANPSLSSKLGYSANAVARACGARVYTLPVSAERVHEALHQQG